MSDGALAILFGRDELNDDAFLEAGIAQTVLDRRIAIAAELRAWFLVVASSVRR